MGLHLRLILTVILGLLRPKVKSLDLFKKNFRVLPIDTHFPYFKALSAGRYFDFMDLVRVEQVTRLGMLPLMLKKRLWIVIGGQVVRYQKPLKLFSRFTVSSRIVYWDESFFYIEHEFTQRGEVKGIGLVQGTFRNREGIYRPQTLVSDVGLSEASPPMPKRVKEWFELTKELVPSTA